MEVHFQITHLNGLCCIQDNPCALSAKYLNLEHAMEYLVDSWTPLGQRVKIITADRSGQTTEQLSLGGSFSLANRVCGINVSDVQTAVVSPEGFPKPHLLVGRRLNANLTQGIDRERIEV